MSVRVRPTARTADQVLLSSKAGALKLMQHGTGEVGITRYGSADHSFPYTLPLDRWTTLTWVADPGRTTLYADGERVGTVEASIPLPMRSIGTEKASLRGDLDELLTWDEALSPAQVQVAQQPSHTRVVRGRQVRHVALRHGRLTTETR
ncbi:LamG-like jellyroll fold domain-containing protein [Streptomyces sp. NPDC091271]|uniref:LamG-like jellyroll fold domain-containing protein n=1 Tax=Streptomyces sp. NPDC091271 TaxID=3365980 RepID=UPI0037FE67BD